jgi:hypothetical protein
MVRLICCRPNAGGELRPTGENARHSPKSPRCGPSAPLGCSATNVMLQDLTLSLSLELGLQTAVSSSMCYRLSHKTHPNLGEPATCRGSSHILHLIIAVHTSTLKRLQIWLAMVFPQKRLISWTNCANASSVTDLATSFSERANSSGIRLTLTRA